jgi:ACS family sodium-dependent inorganic phosphate cotransporter
MLVPMDTHFMSEASCNDASLNTKRFAFLALLGLVAMLTYADRTNMGIVIVSMGDEYEWSAKTRGTVLGAFFFGYICTQIIGGWLSDNLYGGGPVLLVGMVLWSVLLLLTPPATRQVGLPGAIAVRIALGLAEGVCFPSIHSMVPKAIPHEWINASMSFINCMCYVGGVLALLISAPLAAYSGWPAVFYVFGAMGIVWSVSWCLWMFCIGKDINAVKFMRPEIKNQKKGVVSSSTDTSKYDLIEEKEKKSRSPWKLLLTSSPVWALFTCNYCNCWGFWLILTWLPTYFRENFNADLEHLGNLSVLPYAMQGILGLVVGFLGDYLLRKRLIQKRILRSLAQSIAMIGAASLLISLLYIHSQVMAVVLVTCAMSLNSFSNIGMNVNHIDLAPRHSGFLFGLSNSIGIVPGVIGVPLTGWMLESGAYNWDGVFALTAAHYLVGLIVWLLFGSTSVLIP